MSNKFVLLLIALCILLVGCSHCGEISDDYADVKADTTYIAYAESFKSDTSIYTRVDMLYYPVDFDGSALTAIVYYDYMELYVDIFGCRTRNCKDASSVVVRSKDYSYVKLILPPNFEITKAKDSRQIREDYEEKVIDYLFHLNVKTDSVRISWTVEIGTGIFEQCSSPLKPGW